MQITGTTGGKELKYDKMDVLILDVFGMYIPAMEGMENDDYFESENIVTDATFCSHLHLYQLLKT